MFTCRGRDFIERKQKLTGGGVSTHTHFRSYKNKLAKVFAYHEVIDSIL